MHARVSPHVQHLMKALDEVSPRALECAEELRVNTLLARVHFDLTLLKDGTEKIGGRRVGEAGDRSNVDPVPGGARASNARGVTSVSPLARSRGTTTTHWTLRRARVRRRTRTFTS